MSAGAPAPASQAAVQGAILLQSDEDDPMRVLSSNVVLADFIQDPGGGGKKTIHGVVGEVLTNDFPAQVPLWVYWKSEIEGGDGAQHKFELLLRSPSGEVTSRAGAAFSVAHPEIPGLEAVVPFVVMVKEHGAHWVEVHLDEEQVGRASLRVRKP